MGELRKAVRGDYLIDILLPEAYTRFLTAFGAQFCRFEENHDKAVKRVDFVFSQVILGDQDILLAHPVALPAQQAEVRILTVSACGNEFGRSLPGYGVEQEVLRRGEEGLCGLFRLS